MALGIIPIDAYNDARLGLAPRASRRRAFTLDSEPRRRALTCRSRGTDHARRSYAVAAATFWIWRSMTSTVSPASNSLYGNARQASTVFSTVSSTIRHTGSIG